MPTFSADITPEYIVTCLASVLSARPRDREQVFAVARTDLSRWLDACETQNAAPILAPCPDKDRFLAQARTYLRALSTYRPSTDAWLDVFRAFRHLIEHNIVRPKPATPAQPVSRLSHTDIEKLREAPGLPR